MYTHIEDKFTSNDVVILRSIIEVIKYIIIQTVLYDALKEYLISPILELNTFEEETVRVKRRNFLLPPLPLNTVIHLLAQDLPPLSGLML